MMEALLSGLRVLALRMRGVRVGRGVRIGGPVNLLLRDGASARNLSIGDGVVFGGHTEIRMRRNGRVTLADGVSLGTHVWLVTANDAELSIGPKTMIGSYCILNGGHGIRIGGLCWFAAFIYLNSSDHKVALGRPIQEQGYVGAPITIGDDVWVGGHAFIGKGVEIGTGAVVGAGSVVTKSVSGNAIVVGNPARFLRMREPDGEGVPAVSQERQA